MKDIQKSRALQACRLLIEAHEDAKKHGWAIDWGKIGEAVVAARAVFEPAVQHKNNFKI